MFYKFLFYILLTLNCSNCFIIPSQSYYLKNKNCKLLTNIQKNTKLTKLKMIENDNSLQVFGIIIIGHFLHFYYMQLLIQLKIIKTRQFYQKK